MKIMKKSDQMKIKSFQDGVHAGMRAVCNRIDRLEVDTLFSTDQLIQHITQLTLDYLDQDKKGNKK